MGEEGKTGTFDLSYAHLNGLDFSLQSYYYFNKNTFVGRVFLVNFSPAYKYTYISKSRFWIELDVNWNNYSLKDHQNWVKTIITRLKNLTCVSDTHLSSERHWTDILRKTLGNICLPSSSSHHHQQQQQQGPPGGPAPRPERDKLNVDPPQPQTFGKEEQAKERGGCILCRWFCMVEQKT